MVSSKAGITSCRPLITSRRPAKKNHGRPPQSWRATGLLDRQARHIDRFLMLSKSAMQNHMNFGFKHPMTLLPSFLPDSPPLPVQPPIHDRPFFFFAGRLEVIKGLQDVTPPLMKPFPPTS